MQQFIKTILAPILAFISNVNTNIVQPTINGILTTLGNFSDAIVKNVSAAITTAINAAVQSAGFLSYFVGGVLQGLTDAFNQYIVQPIEGFFQGAVNLITGISTKIDTLLQAISQTALNDILNGLSALSSGLKPLTDLLTNGIASLTSAINSIQSGLSGGLSGIVNQLTAVVNQITGSLSGSFSSLYDAIYVYLANLIETEIDELRSALLSAISGIVAGVEGAISGASNLLTMIMNSLNAVATYVSSAFNQLSTGINSLIDSIGQDLDAIGKALWGYLTNEAKTVWNSEVMPVINNVISALTQLQDGMKLALVALLPRSPQQAYDSTFTLLEVGIGSFAVGGTLSLLGDLVHPIKKLGLMDLFNKGLEVSGIAEVTAAAYGIIVESGFRENLRYFFNHELQPHRLSPNESAEGVYYGVLTENDYREELKYEGYNDAAITTKVDTLYRPINARLLVTLFEDNLVSDQFIIGELQKQGFSVGASADILKALQYRALKPFEQNAKSLVYAMFKDGLLDEGTVTNILTAFGTPSTQINYVLAIARLEFAYTQKNLVKAYIIDLLKKLNITPDLAITELEAIGFDHTRAEILVKTAVALAAPTPNAMQRAQLYELLFGTASGQYLGGG